MTIVENIYNYFQTKKIPPIAFYMLSLDIYFTTIFLKKITIETQHFTKSFKHIDECLLELKTNNSLTESLPFIIIDNAIFQEITCVTDKNKVIEQISKIAPHIHIIQLENSDMYNFEKNEHTIIISKNDNTYKRIEQIIFTVCNDFIIAKQKKYNKILFVILSIVILSIISFLTIYATKQL
ncbi:MAG TPA: hypothetical protein PK734_03235 [Bacteroidales bacterium]|nr:hypothetical protein [Bacteroidales bacterium]